MNDLLPKLFSILLFLLILLFIWLSPKEKLSITNPWSIQDLRIWASFLLFIQVVLYLIF